MGEEERSQLVLIHPGSCDSLCRRVPSVLLGALLCFGPPLGIARASTCLDLAMALFQDGEWQACRVECLRVLSEQPTNATARLIHSVSALRTGHKDGIPNLRALIDTASLPPEASAMASYELGRAYWAAGQEVDAFACLKRASETTASDDLFIRSGCSLHALVSQHPALTASTPGLRPLLDAQSVLWSPAVLSECARPSPPNNETWIVKPAQWLITFYRRQIAPAIGNRCSLDPSCSEYARQALRKHGLVGLALIGDRAAREPDVVARKMHPVRVHGRWKYRDALSDHDDWLGRSGPSPYTEGERP